MNSKKTVSKERVERLIAHYRRMTAWAEKEFQNNPAFLSAVHCCYIGFLRNLEELLEEDQ